MLYTAVLKYPFLSEELYRTYLHLILFSVTNKQTRRTEVFIFQRDLTEYARKISHQETLQNGLKMFNVIVDIINNKT